MLLGCGRDGPGPAEQFWLCLWNGLCLLIHRSPLAALLVVLETKRSCSELRICRMASLSLLPWERARRVKFLYDLPVLTSVANHL